MKSRDELLKTLDAHIKTIAIKAKETEACINRICNKTNLPVQIISDYITGRVLLLNANDFELFAIAKEILDEAQLKTFYNASQIKRYSAYKFETKEINSLDFNMIKIAEDQWVGYVDVDKLIQMRDAQLISYNENTQRTLRRINNGEEELYQIYVNKKQVKAITDAYESGRYIPNTITLNVLKTDEGNSADIQYDEHEKVLTLSNIKSIDIIDGYHRYLAISYLRNTHPDFQYSMELRIVNFTEARAKQFIWQEDQKTRMTKMDTAAFNQAKESNKIVNELVKDLNKEGSILYGKISRNAGIINEAFLSQAIDNIYLQDLPQKNKDVAVIKIYKELTEKIRTLIIEAPELFEKKWSRDFIIAVVYWCKYGSEKGMIKYINKLASNQPLYKINKRNGQVIVDFDKIKSILRR